MLWLSWSLGVIWLLFAGPCSATIDRLHVVSQFALQRNGSGSDKPYTVGNGNFAFNADITGLQTLQPFNTLSSWGWHSTPPPPKTPVQRRREGLQNQNDLKGADANGGQVQLQDCWWLHEKVWKPQPDHTNRPGMQPSTPKEPKKISYTEWQTRNPSRINLGRIGLLFNGQEIQPSQITEANQWLNLTTGILSSQFSINEIIVDIETLVSPSLDAVGIVIQSDALADGNISLYLDFPYPRSDQKFEQPFMGDYSVPDLHTTSLRKWSSRGEIKHVIDNTTYYATVLWDNGNPSSTVYRESPDRHRYIFNTSMGIQSQYVIHFSPDAPAFTPRFDIIRGDAIWFWKQYWNSGAFVDCTSTDDAQARELQRRIILSQYHMAVNAAGVDPPQESGLVNNGWYGKFHLESMWWHLAHWERWGKWERIGTIIPTMYRRFLQSSKARAKDQGYEGARWARLADSDGKHTPGDPNVFSIWQQPHPFYFAELEYQAFPTHQTLQKWHQILEDAAKFMVSFPKYNSSSKVYNLEAPIHIASDNTNPHKTRNPTFELAYWRFGLNIMAKWYIRQGFAIPENITKVHDNLAQFPVEDGTYMLYEGVENMWLDPKLTSSHPSIAGIFGMLPPDARLNMTVFQNTMAVILSRWNMTSMYGWDFPLLAMTAVRMGEAQKAVDILLYDGFQFDEVGLPLGGNGVPSPYFPSSGGLLMAVAMLANGWQELHGKHWPRGWTCETEGFNPGL